jgi:hypothetical protein
VLKTPLRLVPRLVMMLTADVAISEAIMAYSKAVTPRRSAVSERILLRRWFTVAIPCLLTRWLRVHGKQSSAEPTKRWEFAHADSYKTLAGRNIIAISFTIGSDLPATSSPRRPPRDVLPVRCLARRKSAR